MRISHSGLTQSTIDQLQRRLSELQDRQGQLASGTRLQRPSDDPSGMNRALSLRHTSRAAESQVQAADDGRTWLNLTDDLLQTGAQRLDRALELAVRGASSLGEPEREAIALEVEAVRDELVDVANTRVRGRPIMAGTSDADPVAQVGGDWVYQGNDTDVTRRVSDSERVRVDVTAAEAFGVTPGGDPDNAFTELDALAQALRDDDGAAVQAAIDTLGGQRDQLLGELARVGAATNQVDSAKNRAELRMESVRTELSSIEDVDLAEAVTEVQTAEVAYQAALGATSRVLQPSLVDYLS